MNDSEEEGPTIEEQLTYWKTVAENSQFTIDSINRSALGAESILELLENGIEAISERMKFMGELNLEPSKILEVVSADLANLIENKFKAARELALQNLEQTFGVSVPGFMFDLTEEQLSKMPEITTDESLICEHCGGQHKVEPSEDQDGNKNDEIVFVQCLETGKCKVVGYKGKNILDFKSEN